MTKSCCMTWVVRALCVAVALVLSPRAALAQTLTWTGAGDGVTFNQAANWSPSVVPGATNDCVINSGSPNPIISSAISVNSITQTVGNLRVPVSLTIASPSTLNNVLLYSGGVITGTGNVEVTGAMTWEAGDLRGAGALKINTGATLLMSTNGTKRIGRLIEIAGQADYAGSSLTMGITPTESGILRVLSGGSFTWSAGAPISGTGLTTPVIENFGTFTKTTSNSVFSANVINWSNSGTFVVQQGTLTVASGAFTTSTAVEVNSGATLQLQGANTFTGSGTVQGAGNLTVGPGTSTFASALALSGSLTTGGPTTLSGGAPNLTGLTVSGGTLTVNGPMSSLTTASISGTWTMNSPVSLGTLTLQGFGQISGTGDVTVTTSMNWTGGSMRGSGKTTVPSGATLSIDTVAGKNLSRTLEIAGVAAYPGTNWTFGAAGEQGVLRVLPTGSFTMSGGTFGFAVNAPQIVDNQGVFIKTGAGSFLTQSPYAWTNSGTFSVQQGTLTIQGTFSTSTSVSVSPGASLILSGTSTFAGAATVTGGGNVSLAGTGTVVAAPLQNSGTLTVAGGTVTLNGGAPNLTGLDVSGGTLTVNGPMSALLAVTVTGGGIWTMNSDVSVPSLTLRRVLNGSGNVTVTGSMLWDDGGEMAGAGQTVIAPGATLAIVGNSNNKNLGRVLIVNGSAEYSGLGLAFGPVANGTLIVGSTGSFLWSGPGAMVNSGGGGHSIAINGLLRKTGSATTAMSNGGPLTVNGELRVEAGTLQFASVAPITNFTPATGTLTGGTWRVLGGATFQVMNVSNFNIRTIASGTTIELEGPTASVLGPFSADALAQVTNINGSLRLTNRTRSVTPTGGTLTNNGLLRLGPGSTLAVTGAFASGPSSVVEVRSSGPGVAQSGRVTATTTGVVDGTLDARPVSGYLPLYADVFPVVSAPSVSGTFDGVVGDGSYAPELEYVSNEARFRYVSCPTLVSSPSDTRGCPRGVQTFGASVSSTGPLAYRWQIEDPLGIGGWTDLPDGPLVLGGFALGTFSGSATATLQRDGMPAGWLDPDRTRQFRCIVTNVCGGVTTSAATLTIGVLGDINGDDAVNTSDLTAFLGSFGQTVPPALPGADVNNDGLVNTQDLTLFLGAFGTVCP